MFWAEALRGLDDHRQGRDQEGKKNLEVGCPERHIRNTPVFYKKGV